MTTNETFAILGNGAAPDDRAAGLDAAASRIAARRRSFVTDGRFLITVAAGLMTLGVSLILVAWVGASHSIRIEEQIPYLISGGLVGVALAVIGAVCLLAHWLTVLIRQTREGQAQILGALSDIARALEREDQTNGVAGSAGADRQVRRSSRR